MKRHFKTIVISNTVHIKTGTIPDHVAANLGQIMFRAIRQDYKDPEIYAGYLLWKKNVKKKHKIIKIFLLK